MPQEGSNNGSDWLRLEKFTKGLLRSHSDVWVVSGPLWLPNDTQLAAVGAGDGAAKPEHVTPLVEGEGEGEGAIAAAATRAKPKPAKAGPVRKRVEFDVVGPHHVAVPTHVYKVVCAEEGGARRLSAFVMPNGPTRGHPPLDTFVVPLDVLEQSAGVQFFPEMQDRHHLPPLCGVGAEAPCGTGAIDGRIQGWKLLGHLKLAADCRELAAAWAEVQARSGKLDTMRMMLSTRDALAQGLACELPRESPSGGVG